MERIGIIGMGISGMAILSAYEKEVDTLKLKIDLYDSRPSFGKGYPFGKDWEQLILNLKTNKIGYDYRNLKDLEQWYSEEDLEKPIYPSRTSFGNYMSNRLEKTINHTKANVIYKKIVRIDKLGEEWEIEDESGNVSVYDRIHLCNGILSQKKLYNLEKNPNYINYIYPVQEKLDLINKSHKVIIIGTGLSAIDISTFLLKEKKIENIIMFSRTNMMPTVRVAEQKLKMKYINMTIIKKVLKDNFDRISFQEFDSLFLKELDHHGINYEEFLETHMQGGVEGLIYNIENPDKLAKVQSLLAYLNLVFNKVWDSMTISDRDKFKEKYHKFMCLNRSPLPYESAEIIINAFNEGKFKIEKMINKVIVNENDKFVIIDKNGERLDNYNYDYVINGSGFDYTLENVEEVNPLIKQLIDKRYIMIDRNGGISVVPETMQAISPRYGTLETLHAYGVLAAGVQYRNNSTMIIQLTAKKIVKELYK